MGERSEQKSILKTDLGQTAMAKLTPAAQQRVRVAWFYFVIALIVACHVWVAVEYDGDGTSGTILGLFQIVIATTSIWVALDSKALQLLPPAKPSEQKASGRSFDLKLDPLRWLAGCLAIWIVFFPLYLSMRSKSKATISPPAKADAAEELRKYKKLLEDGIISEAEWVSKRKELLGTP
jgi:hypothetical protein